MRSQLQIQEGWKQVVMSELTPDGFTILKIHEMTSSTKSECGKRDERERKGRPLLECEVGVMSVLKVCGEGEILTRRQHSAGNRDAHESTSHILCPGDCGRSLPCPLPRGL